MRDLREQLDGPRVVLLLLSFAAASCTPAAPSDDASVDGRAEDSGCAGDLDCDDGVFCNGRERCGSGACAAGTSPCASGEVCDEAGDRCGAVCDVTPDGDGDGERSISCGGADCDDADPSRSPGRTETCDAVDRDEDCDPTTFGFRDADGDAFPDASCCNGTAPARRCGTDCDDANTSVHPTAGEICNGLDDDCDGTTDEGVREPFYRDADGDMYGVATDSMLACTAMGEYRTTTPGDCDDAQPMRHPGAVEVCNGISDEDCDASTHPWDSDVDGYDSQSCGGSDCDDARADVHPGAPDACERGASSDCVEPGEDPDADGFLAIGESCAGGPLDALPRTDCDDASATTHPGALEDCDGADDDCDPSTIGTDDRDGDGFVSAFCCNRQTDGSTRCGPDCEDSTALVPGAAGVHPGAVETCDGADQDCDWRIDEGFTGCADPSVGSLACGGPCSTATSYCCVNLSSSARTCTATTMPCGGGTATVRCDGREDCGAGEVCCGSSMPVGASCAPAASCSATGFSAALCNDHTDCSMGVPCVSQAIPPFGAIVWLCPSG